MNFSLTKPCSNCPFRKDKFFYLDPSRVVSIVEGLSKSSTFSCHKTVRNSKKEESHCAGALIILAKEDKLYSNHTLRVAVLLDLLKPSKLKLNSPVYNTFDEYLDLVVQEDSGE